MTISDRVTNQSVADKLGIDQSYVSLIRRGIRVPSRDVVVALVEAYDVSDTDHAAELLAAYTSRDPAAFATKFNRIVGFPETEVTEDA
jgi:transcriptional regulator with XRE-family HTH domain